MIQFLKNTRKFIETVLQFCQPKKLELKKASNWTNNDLKCHLNHIPRRIERQKSDAFGLKTQR